MLPVGLADEAADVVVYGSTPGGFCAAIAAAREGAKVILLEPTEHVGGLTTGGLSHCDSNQMVRTTLRGLFEEWHGRVVKDYTDRGLQAAYDPTKKDQSPWTFETNVAMRVTKKMLTETGVVVKTGQAITGVTKDGPRITTLVTAQGMFRATAFVDGSYEGDLMAAAGVEWTIGREGRAEFGESYAGKQYPKPKLPISGRDDQGRLLPLVTTADAGATEAGDANVMTYSFRLCLTRDPANRVPPPEPARYDPARFEIARRVLAAGGRVGFVLYPLPGAKFDGNNSINGHVSLGLIGGGNSWNAGDRDQRRAIWEAHRQYTLEFLHFLRTDPDVPAKIRETYADLGLCRDEFAETGHFPPALYVRESRRMRGVYVICQKDIVDSPLKDDPIAISSFPIDSHDCQRVALPDGGVVNEGTIYPVLSKGKRVGYAYHVPYRAILPKPGQCANLLVPVALSCTHVAISSLRIEAAWMVIGQAAGIAAAQAADRNVAVHDLPYAILRERLLAQGQVLDLPGDKAP
ncbi:MAG: FAD-dependent oxidoreductase [Planctomycetia bacterium]